MVSLSAQDPGERVEAAWSESGRVDALVSNDAHPVVHAAVADADVDALRRTF